MARPKKYKTTEQAKQAHKLSTTKGRYFFLTIPALEGSDKEIEELKKETFNLLVQKEERLGLEHLGVVRETHLDGLLHLHVYVQYKKQIMISFKHFDYLIKHPNVQRVKGLKQVLEYLVKEDLNPMFSAGFNPMYEIDKVRIEKEPFALLYEAMKKDPLNFKPWQWIHDNNLSVAASRGNWPKALSQLKKEQETAANKSLRSCIGMRQIDSSLIHQSLTAEELQLYHSWDGYQKIVDYLNDVPRYGFNRPHKRKNLMIVGRPDIGKTTLARKIRQYVAVYSFGVENWFPRYQNWVYPMILWNQFYLRAMPYGQLLNVLEGEPTDLPYKGGSTLKRDNQLVFITSNMSLQQHICHRFNVQEKRAMSRANLSTRIAQITVPEDKDLFLLLKLIHPAKD